MRKDYPEPDGGLDAMKPDAYDENGNLTINSWYLHMCDEIDREDDE